MSFAKIKEYVLNLEEQNYIGIISSLEKDSRKNVQLLAKSLKNKVEKKKAEIARVKKMYEFDRGFNVEGIFVGVDEVGRGPLAGPIVSAAVVLDLNVDYSHFILQINDSKKLSPKKREELSKIIREKALYFNIALIDEKTIDKMGIGYCNQKVLHDAAMGISVLPDFVLSDGYPIKKIEVNSSYSIKGDSKSASIACASIVAKVYRDNLMKEYSEIYPQYHFEKNSGYGSKEHIAAIKEFGPCEIHRRSFLRNII